MQRGTVRGAPKKRTLPRLHRLVQRVLDFMGTPLARKLVLGLFVVQAVILVFVVHIGVPPDEMNHISFIEYYAHHSLSPVFNHQQPTYNLGDKTREVDYLYHYGMSLVYRVLPLTVATKYAIIRLFSVVFGLLSFIILGKILKRVGLTAAAITFSLLILTNLPMVLMMSSAINNDALVWLGTTLGVLLLLRLWEQPRLLDLLWLAVLSVSGGLFKRTLLPLGILFAILGLIVAIKHYKILLSQLKRGREWHIALVCVVLLLSIGLFAERVGGNIIQYHTVSPSCQQIDGDNACAIFWANIRADDLSKLPPEAPLSLARFAGEWFYSSIANVLDIQTQLWLHIVQPPIWLPGTLMALLVVGIGYGAWVDTKLRRQNSYARLRLYVLLIAVYFLVIHLFVNYGNYEDSKFFGIALNGRYIIPSLLPLVGLACFYWAKLLERRQTLLVVAATVVIAIMLTGSGLQMMLRNAQLYRNDPRFTGVGVVPEELPKTALVYTNQVLF